VKVKTHIRFGFIVAGEVAQTYTWICSSDWNFESIFNNHKRRNKMDNNKNGQKLAGKIAVITGGTSGMALASAKRFVEEGAYVFITGRRQEQLDKAVKQIGRNVTGVQGDSANLNDLDRLFDTVRREKGRIDILFASAGIGEVSKIGEITEKHFDWMRRRKYSSVL
jgi:NADP-dependent 3-hydroxy acid dehydrogenase YdfG